MRYIIAGYGKFGKIALERLRAFYSVPSIVVVDPTADLSELVQLPNVIVVQADAVKFLIEQHDIVSDDMVIPMVPFHLAASYALNKLSRVREALLPESIMRSLPNPIRINECTISCSRANFLCPDDCPESDRCSVTGELRDMPLYEELESLQIEGAATIIQRSIQILPGVGGYRLGELIRLEGLLQPGMYAIATSCKCHAILTGIFVAKDPIER